MLQLLHCHCRTDSHKTRSWRVIIVYDNNLFTIISFKMNQISQSSNEDINFPIESLPDDQPEQSPANVSQDEKNESLTKESRSETQPEKNKKRRCHRAQKFRQNWLTNSKLNTWLTTVPHNPYKGQCRVCKLEFTAELTVIKNHLKSRRHRRSIREAEPNENGIHLEISEDDSDRIGENLSSDYERNNAPNEFLEVPKYTQRKKRTKIQQNIYENDDDILLKELTAIGENVTFKLKRMSPQQRNHAELLINKVLISGLKNKLSDDTDLTEVFVP